MRDFVLMLRARLVLLEKAISGCLIFALMLIVFWGVLERYLLQSSSGWTDETARYVCIWGVMIGASIGVVRGSHIGVDVLIYMLPTRWQFVLAKIVYAICGVFCLWIVAVGSTLVTKLFTIMQLTATLEIPIGYMYLALPVGFALMALHFVLQFYLADIDCAKASNKEGAPL